MRRLIAVATLVAALPLWGQGRRMGPMAASHSPGFVSRSGGFVPRAPRIGHGPFRASPNGFPRFRHHPRIFFRFGGRTCDPFFFDCRFFFHQHFFGQPAFFPIPIYSEYPYQPVYEEPATQPRDDVRELALENQIAELTSAIEDLRSQEQSRSATNYQPSQSPPPKMEESGGAPC